MKHTFFIGNRKLELRLSVLVFHTYVSVPQMSFSILALIIENFATLGKTFFPFQSSGCKNLSNKIALCEVD